MPPQSKMECSITNAKNLAAAEALTVSEQALQRVKQQGCGTTRQDRSIMQLPDLKAFTYPVPTNVPVEVSAGANNKYMGRSSVNAEGFVPPFVNVPQEEGSTAQASNLVQSVSAVAQGSPAVAGLDFAGTGNIAQLDNVMMGNPPVLYKQMAAAIQGQAPGGNELAEAKAPKILEEPLTPLGRAAVVGADEVRTAHALERRLYGAGSGGAAPAGTFPGAIATRCQAAVTGALYDCVHLDEALRMHAPDAPRCISTTLRVLTRDGRMPYLVFVTFLMLLLVFLLVTQRPQRAPAVPLLPPYNVPYNMAMCRAWPPGPPGVAGQWRL
jgi:hypothetical protein